MPAKLYNHNYYQSGDYMVVSFIGLQGIPQENIIVDIQPKSLHVTINTPNFDSFEKTLTLFKEIDPATSTYKYYPSKVEIKLHKVEPMNWPSLEVTNVNILPTPQATPFSSANNFSTANWDKFCEENKEEVDTSGDNLFKILFRDANPEQKRAMLKSMQQSHGKVLNMNWEEVKDNSYDEGEENKEEKN